MGHSWVAYVDESGDEGFRFGQGSSEWFVLAAALTFKAEDLEATELINRVRTRLHKHPKKPLHFRNLKHEQRLPLIQEIVDNKSMLRIVTVLIHKPSLREPEKFQAGSRLYFYAVRLLLERVSWLCRDQFSTKVPGDGSAELVFSNRGGMSYQEMRDYLDRLQMQASYADIRVDWNVIKSDQLVAFSSGRHMGLQIADAVASNFFYAVELSQYGFIEDRYARMLKSVVYGHRGRDLGYGLKFWPADCTRAWVDDYKQKT